MGLSLTSPPTVSTAARPSLLIRLEARIHRFILCLLILAAGIRTFAGSGGTIATGGYHTLVVKSDGTVWAWGYNGYGQTNVPAGLTNVVAIAAGGFHALALRADGTVIAWGTNSYGQTNVPIGLSNVVAVAAGQWNSMALKADGTVVAWGAGTTNAG